ncbi:MAG: hypothetical protein J6T19_04870 [Paludibacteraceae bacterium]|nr:hypothetical protein [Paludibacteraceae bacterium]
MKKYENPMLQIVSIKQNDIIVTSGEHVVGMGGNLGSGTFEAGAADRFRDDWDAGY